MAGLDGMDVKMLYGENMMASFPQNIVDVRYVCLNQRVNKYVQ